MLSNRNLRRWLAADVEWFKNRGATDYSTNLVISNNLATADTLEVVYHKILLGGFGVWHICR